jgi:hypothetical protein
MPRTLAHKFSLIHLCSLPHVTLSFARPTLIWFCCSCLLLVRSVLLWFIHQIPLKPRQTFQRTTESYSPGHRTLLNHRSGDFKSYILHVLWERGCVIVISDVVRYVITRHSLDSTFNRCPAFIRQGNSNILKNTKIGINKTIILPFVLYGCETWCLALREEHRLRVFENRVLRRIFGPKRDEETGRWRKLHNELYNLYISPGIIRMIK